MPNPQLTEYITQSIAQGASKEEIKSALLGAGWKEADVNEGLLAVFPVSMQRSAVGGKSKALIMIVSVLAALLLAGGGFAYWYFVYEPEQQDGIGPFFMLEVQLPNGVYTNERFGYRVKVPSGWRLASQMSIFSEATKIVFEMDTINPDSDKLVENVKRLNGERLAEILRLKKTWKPEHAEIVIFTTISAIEEDMLVNGNTAGEWPQNKIIQITADKGMFDIKKTEDKENEFVLVKKISTYNGVPGMYLSMKGSPARNKTFAVEPKLPVSLASGKVLGNIILESWGMIEEDFLVFARSLELF